MSFEPKGDRARWRVVYDLISALKEDEIITYETLGNALNLHPATDRPTMAVAVHRAAKQLEERDERALQCITNVGYRVISPAKHAEFVDAERARMASLVPRNQVRANSAEVNRLVESLRRVLLTQLQEIEVLSAGQDALGESLARLEACVTGEET